MADPPGWKLKRRLRGHAAPVTRLAWSRDGSALATPSVDGTVVIWDAASGRATRIIRHEAPVSSVTFSPDGKFVASCVDDRQDAVWHPSMVEVLDEPLDPEVDQLLGHYEDALSWEPDDTAPVPEGVPMSIRINEVATGLRPATLWSARVRSWPIQIDWSSSGRLLVTASDDGVAVWQARTGELLHLFTDAGFNLTDLCFGRGGDAVAAVTWDGFWFVWDAASGKLLRAIESSGSDYQCLAWSDGGLLACGAADGSIEIWRTEDAALVRILEGHPGEILSLSYSHDGRLLASKGNDGWVRLWDTSRWDVVTELREPVGQKSGLESISFSPTGGSLATLGKRGVQVRLWDLDSAAIAANRERPPTTHYANAKVVLVGDTSVGKTGLGLVLAGELFRPTESTHRRHVWLLDREITSEGGEPEIREVYLWDLAGQPGYRLLHQLHLRDVAVALVLFDAKGESEPFSGVRHWVRALRQAEAADDLDRSIPRLLIAARLDRGGPAVSDERVQLELLNGSFAGFHRTSAKQGWGVAELGEELRGLIAWNEMPRVSSTGVFDSVKDFLTAQQQQEQLLVPLDALYRAYLTSGPEHVTREEFSNCLGRLAARGLVRPFSFGTFMLLQPELLDAYAAALVNAAREQPDGMGSLSEDDVLAARVPLPADERVDDQELERLLLIACVEDLLRHEVALRENSDDGTLLVFPTQSRREAPALDAPQQPWTEIRFEGPVQHVYATLAVRLAHSGFFDLRGTYVGATTFGPKGSDHVIGVSVDEPDEGIGVLTLFGNADVPVVLRGSFDDFVVSHVRRRATSTSVVVAPTTLCTGCNYRVSSELRQQADELGRSSISCPFCATRIELSVRDEEAQDTELVVRQMDREANQRRDRAAAQSTVQGKEEVHEFDVFLAHNSKDKLLVARLAERLRERALNPWFDDEQVPPGRWFQDVIEAAVPHVRAAAIVVGTHGLGTWEHEELRVFLQQCAEANTPVIPVRLGNADIPKGLRFLRQRRWVEMPSPEDDEALDLLIWGITGHNPRAKHPRAAAPGSRLPVDGPTARTVAVPDDAR